MYIVKLYNEGIETEIHGEKAKLKSGSLVQGSGNVIDSFSFSMNPSSPGFSSIKDYKTKVTIYNTRTGKYVFYGRVLCSTPEMDVSGSIFKSVVCESYLGYLCDSKQKYVYEKNWTVNELWEHIISVHNSLVEPEKQFAIGQITVQDKNDNLYLGIQREETWQTIKTKLIDTLGGEVRFRVVDGVNYIDHLESIGETRATEIKISHNMKAIRQENDPTAYITRLIPLGAKLLDEEGNETEDRLDITSVNNGLDYIEDVDAREAYGIRVDYVYFDGVTVASTLKNKGESFLVENNRTKVKYSISYVDLSLLGIDIDSIEVYDYYPIVNGLLGINDVARVIKKTTDVCDETKSTIEVGDTFKTLSSLQATQSNKINSLGNSVNTIKTAYATKNELISESNQRSSAISASENGIMAQVENTYTKQTTVEDLEKTLRGRITLTESSFSGQFSDMEKKIQDVNGDLQSKYNLITKYFTFDINGLLIGALDKDGNPSPNKVIIDNDEIKIMVGGVAVQKFDAEGNAVIPMLTVEDMLSVLGLKMTEDETHINCEYVG